MNTDLKDARENEKLLKPTARELAQDSMQLRAESLRLRTVSADLVAKLRKSMAQRATRNPRINASTEEQQPGKEAQKNDQAA